MLQFLVHKIRAQDLLLGSSRIADEALVDEVGMWLLKCSSRRLVVSPWLLVGTFWPCIWLVEERLQDGINLSVWRQIL